MTQFGTHRPAGICMLDVLTDAGLDAPFSCRQGICGACACQLTGGEVQMAHNEILEDEDVADGYILACQAVALTPRSASPTDQGQRLFIITSVRRRSSSDVEGFPRSLW